MVACTLTHFPANVTYKACATMKSMRLRLDWHWHRRLSQNTIQQGFTLLEVLIVIVLLSVALFIALPAIDRQLRWTDRTRMETALIDAIQQARSGAMENGMVTRMRHHYPRGELRIERMAGIGNLQPKRSSRSSQEQAFILPTWNQVSSSLQSTFFRMGYSIDASESMG